MLVKGICEDINGVNCSLKGKIQNVDDSDFICRECGSQLFPAPKTLAEKIKELIFNKIVLLGITIFLIIGGVLAWFFKPDTTPPLKPILLSKDISKTYKDSIKVIISGEKGASVYINNKSINKKINKEGNISFIIPIKFKVGEIREFNITLRDDANNSSVPLSLKIKKIKDTIPPKKPIIKKIPTETTKDSETVTIYGEEGASIFIDDNYIGKIKNGTKEIILDTSGKPGNKNFLIYLQDKAGNKSKNLKLTVKKIDITPPDKPKILSSIPNNICSNSYELKISGEIDADVYINEQKVGKIDKNGEFNTTLDISKERNYKIFLKDKSGNSSEKEILTLKKYTPQENLTIEDRKFAYISNCKQKIRFQIMPYITSDIEPENSIYTDKYIETNKPFYIQTTPVTIKQFGKFVKETNYQPEGVSKNQFWNIDENNETNPNYPVTNVSLNDIKKYIEWFSNKTGKKYRLPTVKEWIITINQNIIDNDIYTLRPIIDPKADKVRYFMSNMYEFSSTYCNDNKSVVLLGKDYITDIRYAGVKRCEYIAHQFVTFRLVLDIE